MPPTTVFAIAAVGISAFVFLMLGAIPRLRRARVLVAVTPMAPVAGVPGLDEPNRRSADDALDLARMDDDGRWQMAQPPV